MEHLWTWSGTYFGYRQGDALFSKTGRQAGRFQDADIYGRDGRYLGELRQGRLVTSRTRSIMRGGSFGPLAGSGGFSYANVVGYVMLAGYEDFPPPDQF